MKCLLKKAIAEMIGTFVLVFVACGTAALTNGSIVPTAMAFGLVIVAMAYSIGRISGCHINPAVSLGCLIAKRMSVKEFFVYVVSQVIGGLIGAFAIFGIIKMAGLSTGDACNNIVGGFANGYTTGGVIGALLTEIILTCIFVYVILNVTDESNNTSKKAGVIIGFTLTLVHIVGISLTGTSVNPARSLATAVTQLVFFGSTDALNQVWIFIVAPLIGGALAAILFSALHSSKKEAE
jgi:aquaporin Z